MVEERGGLYTSEVHRLGVGLGWDYLLRSLDDLGVVVVGGSLPMGLVHPIFPPAILPSLIPNVEKSLAPVTKSPLQSNATPLTVFKIR